MVEICDVESMSRRCRSTRCGVSESAVVEVCDVESMSRRCRSTRCGVSESAVVKVRDVESVSRRCRRLCREFINLAVAVMGDRKVTP